MKKYYHTHKFENYQKLKNIGWGRETRENPMTRYPNPDTPKTHTILRPTPPITTHSIRMLLQRYLIGRKWKILHLATPDACDPKKLKKHNHPHYKQWNKKCSNKVIGFALFWEQ